MVKKSGQKKCQKVSKKKWSKEVPNKKSNKLTRSVNKSVDKNSSKKCPRIFSKTNVKKISFPKKTVQKSVMNNIFFYICSLFATLLFVYIFFCNFFHFVCNF